MKKELYFGEKVKIRTENIDENTLKEKLKGFYIEKTIKKSGDEGEELHLRNLSKEVKKIELGEKSYEIRTLSNLKEGEREIYEKLKNAPGEWVFPAGIILLIFSILLFFWKGKKKKTATPMEEFRKRIENITGEEWSYETSLALREFLDRSLGTKFLQGIYEEKGVLISEDIQFLKDLDYIKYSGKNLNYQRENIIKRAREIAQKIGEVKNDKI